MIWWHRVGQKVVCKDTKWVSRASANKPSLNQILTIREVLIGDIFDASVVFLFEEIMNKKGEYLDREHCFYHWHFKPVKDTNIEQFKQLLNPKPEDIKQFERELENV